MIPQYILEKLVCFSEEEINNLNGQNDIDRSIFINQKSNTIDYHHLLEDNQLFSVRKHTRFCQYPAHKHNYIELMYVYGGSMTHTIESKNITIHQGELLLLNQNIEHAIDYCDENDIIFNFIIRPEFLSFLSTMLDDDNDVSRFIFDTLYSYDNDGEYLVFKVQDNDKVKEYIESIIIHLYEPRLHNDLELKLLVGLLLTELMNHPESIESYSGDSYEKVLGSMILKYIHLNYKEGSLAELSALIHQPNYKICKLIKKQTHQTFTQLLQDEKLKVATHLLVTTNMSMNDLIIEVGYENISYFYRIFKKKYQMTPQDYRRQFQRSDIL
ncbi:MAG: AraC family transcriptional regulator [Longibaculum sp.]